jgi:sulfatase maturation enzyme AslB (radical SAM superfamily)
VACFLDTDASHAEQRQAVIGRLLGNRLAVDDAAIQALRRRLHARSEQCETCFNQFHCARGCPESCPLDRTVAPDFLCRVRQQLACAHLKAQAERMWRAQGCPVDVAGAPTAP